MNTRQEENTLLQFNKWANFYDTPVNYLTFYLANRKLLRLLNLQKANSILDVGCGTGILLEQLLKTGNDLQLFGLDISDTMLTVAKKKFSGTNVQLTLGSAIHMPFKDNSFDFVTCVHSFHHHPDTLQSLKEMKRVVKKGGKVIILDNFLDGIFRKGFHNLERKLFPEREKDIQRFTKEGMRELFQLVGFKNIQHYIHQYFVLITIGEK